MKNKTICCDVDGVCADLMKRWLFEYNESYSDNLKSEDIKSWDTDLYVKTECGKNIYNYIKYPNEKIYNYVEPIDGSINGINFLRENEYKIIFVTAFEPKFSYVKFNWLNKWGFLKEKSEYVETLDKSIIGCDFMIDDKFENVESCSGIGVLFTQPHNKNNDWYPRANNWTEVIKIIEGYPINE